MNSLLLYPKSLAVNPSRRRAVYMVLLFLVGIFDYVGSGRTARTFVFASRRDGKPLVERRFLPRANSREDAIARYVSEYLLGPTDVASLLLFDKEAALRSLFIRDGIAHVDLTAESAFPVEQGGDVRQAVDTLKSGIERNFSSIKHVVVYMEGREPFVSSLNETLPLGSGSKKGKSVDK